MVDGGFSMGRLSFVSSLFVGATFSFSLASFGQDAAPKAKVAEPAKPIPWSEPFANICSLLSEAGKKRVTTTKV